MNSIRLPIGCNQRVHIRTDGNIVLRLHAVRHTHLDLTNRTVHKDDIKVIAVFPFNCLPAGVKGIELRLDLARCTVDAADIGLRRTVFDTADNERIRRNSRLCRANTEKADPQSNPCNLPAKFDHDTHLLCRKHS